MDLIQNSLNNNLLNGQVSLQQMNPLNAANKTKEAQTDNTLQSFGDLLKDQLQQINELQGQANKSVEIYAMGGDIELHNVIIAVEKADMALQMAAQVRNRLVSAYQEVSRMQF